MPRRSVIELSDVHFSYFSKNSKIEALQDVSFSIKEKEFVSIIGPSGCGKTTLLKLIGGLLNPESGKIAIDGNSVENAVNSRKLGFVFQSPTLLKWRNVMGNVLLPSEIISNASADDSVKKCEALLKMVGLSEFKNNYPGELSLGMQQRVSIARALSLDPKILLMDEPFSSLDELKREELNLELVKIWRKSKNAVLFVTHSISEAIFLSDKIIVLSKRPGRVKEIIEVNLPRPRTLKIKDTKQFFQLKNYIRSLME